MYHYFETLKEKDRDGTSELKTFPYKVRKVGQNGRFSFVIPGTGQQGPILARITMNYKFLCITSSYCLCCPSGLPHTVT
jgi:hypothetical protein